MCALSLIAILLVQHKYCMTLLKVLLCYRAREELFGFIWSPNRTGSWRSIWAIHFWTWCHHIHCTWWHTRSGPYHMSCQAETPSWAVALLPFACSPSQWQSKGEAIVCGIEDNIYKSWGGKNKTRNNSLLSATRFLLFSVKSHSNNPDHSRMSHIYILRTRPD